MAPTFEWDDEKAAVNLAKHNVSFEESATVFGDSLEVTVPDPRHSIGEQRYVSIGTSEKGRLLIVAYTECGNNIRIISCREATRRERRIYEEI